MNRGYYEDLLKHMHKKGGLIYIEQIHGKDANALIAQIKDKFKYFPVVKQINSGAIVTIMTDNGKEFPSLNVVETFLGPVQNLLKGESYNKNQEIFLFSSDRAYNKEEVVVEIMPHWYID